MKKTFKTKKLLQITKKPQTDSQQTESESQPKIHTFDEFVVEEITVNNLEDEIQTHEGINNKNKMKMVKKQVSTVFDDEDTISDHQDLRILQDEEPSEDEEYGYLG